MSEDRGADDLWAGFALDPRTPAHVDLRASDADRDRVAGVLASAFADGRLDREELDDRTAALMSTRTLGELPGLVHDLVAPARPGSPTTPSGALDLTTATTTDLQARAEQEWASQRRGALLAFLGPTLICWAVWVATGVGGNGQLTFPWPLIVMAATGFHAVRTLTNRREIVETELQRLQEARATTLGRGTDDQERRG